MAPLGAGSDDGKGVGEVVTDLWELVRDYAKQETIDPLKGVAKFIAWGLGGAILLALGIMFMTLAVLRGLQTQTGDHLTGDLTWVPYLVALVVDVIAILLAVTAIRRPFRAEEKRA